MLTKDQTAQLLADVHFRLDQGTRRVFRVTDVNESNDSEPLKLLEVNDMTPEVGIMPIAMPASPQREVYFSSVIIEVTPGEFERLRRGEMTLPHGWKLSEELFEQTNNAFDQKDSYPAELPKLLPLLRKSLAEAKQGKGRPACDVLKEIALTVGVELDG